MPSSTDSVCIFVSSSNRTRDVFDRVFAHFSQSWPDCPYARFVGLTTAVHEPDLYGFTPIAAEGESGWRQELSEQLAKLPAQFDHVLLLLDDFLLLDKVDTGRIKACVQHATARDMAYLRMKPLDRSWVATFLRRLAAPATIAEQLVPNERYYSSLQAAVWRTEHLLWMLAQPGSIWQFEHVVPPEAHWAVRKQALSYRHVVEKGRWMADTGSLFRRLGHGFDPGARSSWPWRAGWQWQLGRIKFRLFGYSVMKVKRLLRK